MVYEIFPIQGGAKNQLQMEWNHPCKYGEISPVTHLFLAIYRGPIYFPIVLGARLVKLGSTWVLIPVGKWLVTPIYKPWKGHLEGERCPT